MAAAGHYLAAQAAFRILEAGGNAVDAGVAGGIALGVVHSEYVNFAGVAPIMLYLAEERRVITISGLGTWPRAATRELFTEQHDGRIPPGVLRTVVPAAPDAWITALERFGTMGFGEVAAAAIGFARDGFPASSFLSTMIANYAAEYRRWPSNAAIYLPGDVPPKTGDMFFQNDLAQTLQYMANEESAAAAKDGRAAGLAAARAAFYRHDIAAAIIHYHAENGGLLTAEDLAAFRVGIEEPVETQFADHRVYACGPWCQGPVLPQTLNLLDGIDLVGLGHNSPEYIHRIVESLKLAFADRHAYYGDPRFVGVPMDILLSSDYADRRRTLIRPDMAWPGMPPAGTPQDGAGAAHMEAASEWTDQAPDTAYICVVDSHGNAFSATPSDGSMDGPIIPGTGICPSTRGAQSWTDPAVPACLAPGKRPRLTPSPAMAIRPGRSVMPFGTPGNDVQPQAMVQTLMNMIAFGMTPQNAVEAPRFATYSYPASSEPHAYQPGRLNLESRIPPDTGARLGAMGHKVEWWPEWEFRAGALCAIVADSVTGVMEGAADPRRAGAAIGW